jgi:acetyl-CoA carboxylase biotin carboxyl carrier protein
MAKNEQDRESLLNPATLRDLLQRLEATDVDELEVASGSSRLYLRRDPRVRSIVQRRESHAEGAPLEGVPVVAPLTGVFYARPAPDQPLFVVPGATVEIGQVVALIETMKLFNEVTAETAGEVLSVTVHENDLVEVGQPLLYVRPREEKDQS